MLLWTIAATLLYVTALIVVATRRWSARRKAAVAAVLSFLAFLPIGCVTGFSYPGDDRTSCVLLIGIEVHGFLAFVAPFVVAVSAGVLFWKVSYRRPGPVSRPQPEPPREAHPGT